MPLHIDGMLAAVPLNALQTVKGRDHGERRCWLLTGSAVA
jgi:hypothetical protein